MSTMKIYTKNMQISPDDIVKQVKNKTQCSDYDETTIEDIINNVIEIFRKTLSIQQDTDIKMIDDEELFDKAYDFILDSSCDISKTADIACIVNEVLGYIEDTFYDKGLIEYTN